MGADAAALSREGFAKVRSENARPRCVLISSSPFSTPYPIQERHEIQLMLAYRSLVMKRFKDLGIRSILGERAILPSSAAANYLIPTPKTITTTKNSIIACNIVVRLSSTSPISSSHLRSPLLLPPSLHLFFLLTLTSLPPPDSSASSARLYRPNPADSLPPPQLPLCRLSYYQPDPDRSDPADPRLAHFDPHSYFCIYPRRV
jgi:hypothetical protein